MYHIYEAETQNEEIDWHIYAENYESACKIMRAFNKRITCESKKLMDSIHYGVIADELRSGVDYECERKEIEKFFSLFKKPIIRKKGMMGGYVLDYRQCSVRKNVEMPYKIMLSYLDTLQNNDFFESVLISPVYSSHHEINIPDHDVKIKMTFGMNKRYGYGNEALLSAAGAKLNFHLLYVGEDSYGWKDFFMVELKNVLEFCQFLNYLPFIDICNVIYTG